MDGLCPLPILKSESHSSASELSCSKKNSLTIIRWYKKKKVSPVNDLLSVFPFVITVATSSATCNNNSSQL